VYPTTVNGKISVEGKTDEPTSETTIQNIKTVYFKLS